MGTRRFQRAVSVRRPIASSCASCRDCALEATRTQAAANQCVDYTGILFAQPSINLWLDCRRPAASPQVASANIFIDYWNPYFSSIFLLRASGTQITEQVSEPKRVSIIQANNHRFEGNTGEFYKQLREGLKWMK